MRIQRRRFLLLIWTTLLSGLSLLNIPFCNTIEAKQPLPTFNMIYEPSTVIQLRDGNILIAEDEGDISLFLSPLVNIKSVPGSEPVRLQQINGVLDDLEGSALGKGGEVYLITSHSTDKKGKRKKKEES